MQPMKERVPPRRFLLRRKLSDNHGAKCKIRLRLNSDVGSLIKISLKMAFVPLPFGGVEGGAQLRQREKANYLCARAFRFQFGAGQWGYHLWLAGLNDGK